jgi:hypothetical protein
LTRPVGAAEAATARARPTSGGADAAPLSTARAIPAIVAALTAADEVDDRAASAVPRPAGSKRLYFQALDEATLVSVYVASGAPADVFRAYSGVLGASGFVVRYDLPSRAAGVNVLATRKEGASALVTLSQGEGGTLVTLVETRPALVEGEESRP